ncbi:MAG: hypothetical protein SH821_16380, partial [Phototrophicales bacterium]|nr:hypothetical protein [Phototrophicales bacterium]
DDSHSDDSHSEEASSLAGGINPFDGIPTVSLEASKVRHEFVNYFVFHLKVYFVSIKGYARYLSQYASTLG